MQALLDPQEIVEPIAQYMLIKHLKKKQIVWRILKKTSRHQPINLEKLQEAANKDLSKWRDSVVTEYKKKYRPLIKWLSNNIDRIPIPLDDLIVYSINQSNKSIIKTLAPQLSNNINWVTSNSLIQNDPILIRNILGNEHLIALRIQEQYPFWFVDSGYTNFLTKKKNWHRLVKNHIHQSVELKYFPADRLNTLTVMPQPWRHTGNKILVVESSEMHYKIFGTSLTEWRKQVQDELKKVTDRPVEFRPKELDRKSRTSVYELLQNTDEYYCVVSDASAAAIESIWCGVPVITLGKHISNSVARSNISDIDNLYRGPIGDWLCALTYSQFTYKEFESGYALEMLGKYYGITV